MKIQKTCPICGKNYQAYPYEKLFCSGECYYQSKKGKSWGGALNKGKRVGKYNDDRVEKMATGKKEAHLQRALEHPEYLKIDEARNLLKEGYPVKLSQFSRALGYNKLTISHRYFADICYMLFEKEHLSLCKKDIPFAIASLSLDQIRWFKNLLTVCENWEDFEKRFLGDYERMNVYRSTGYPSTIIKFVQETNFPTKALREDLGINKTTKGYSTEKAFRSILQEMEVSFKEQVTLKSKAGRGFRPDFIVNNKLIVEVNGDYWHGYGKKLEELSTRIRQNVLNDLRKYEFYEQEGFKYLIVWEHELREKETILKTVKEALKNESIYRDIV